MTELGLLDGWDDEELWLWLNRMADEHEAKLEHHWARTRQLKEELDRAGRRMMPRIGRWSSTSPTTKTASPSISPSGCHARLPTPITTHGPN